MRSPIFSKGNCCGFSLVEIVLALGIATIALVSMIGFLPKAMEGASDGADQTAIGLMLEDVHDRIEGALLKVGEVSVLDQDGKVVGKSPFFYDQRGVYVDPNKVASEQDSIVTGRFYRVEVEIVKPESSASTTNLGEVLAIKVDLFWPIKEDGEAFRPDKPGSSVTYFTAAKTGPGWRNTDSTYEPKIEY